MKLFDDILRNNESLFINDQALDYDYTPREIPFREKQQNYIAEAIKPLFQGKSGRNLFITGTKEIDKATAVKNILREVEEKTKDIFIEIINCQKKEQLKLISKIPKNKAAIIVFESVECLKEVEILNSISKNFNKKCILMISDDKYCFKNIKSSLNADILEFEPYSYHETINILEQRANYAFYPGVIDKPVIKFIAKRAFVRGGIRTGIFLLKESGNIAEMNKSKKVLVEHCEKAIEKLDLFIQNKFQKV